MAGPAIMAGPAPPNAKSVENLLTKDSRLSIHREGWDELSRQITTFPRMSTYIGARGFPLLLLVKAMLAIVRYCKDRKVHANLIGVGHCDVRGRLSDFQYGYFSGSAKIDEDLDTAVLRELAEEVGVKGKDLTLWGTRGRYSVYTVSVSRSERIDPDGEYFKRITRHVGADDDTRKILVVPWFMGDIGLFVGRKRIDPLSNEGLWVSISQFAPPVSLGKRGRNDGPDGLEDPDDTSQGGQPTSRAKRSASTTATTPTGSGSGSASG